MGEVPRSVLEGCRGQQEPCLLHLICAAHLEKPLPGAMHWFLVSAEADWFTPREHPGRNAWIRMDQDTRIQESVRNRKYSRRIDWHCVQVVWHSLQPYIYTSLKLGPRGSALQDALLVCASVPWICLEKSRQPVFCQPLFYFQCFIQW